MNVSYPNGSLKPVVAFSKNDGEIRYTLDGSEPNGNSLLYTKPFSINKTSVAKAIAVLPNALSSDMASAEVKCYTWLNATNVKNLKTGISWKYYEPEGTINLESIQTSPVKKEGITDVISEKVKQREDKYALQFDGYINISKEGIYNFFTYSDDGSKLFIDDEEVVNNDWEHGGMEASGRAALKKGFHKIKVVYFDSGGGNELKVSWQNGKGNKETIPANVLFHVAG